MSCTCRYNIEQKHDGPILLFTESVQHFYEKQSRYNTSTLAPQKQLLCIFILNVYLTGM